jgi:hypothetical protein
MEATTGGGKPTMVRLGMVALLAAMLALAGCGSSGSASPAGEQPSGQAEQPSTPAGESAEPAEESAEPAETTGAEPGETGLSPWKQAFQFDKLNWYSFTAPGGGTMKVEYANEDHNGVAARKVTTYSNGDKQQESWVDATTGAFLGGTMYLGGMEQEMGESDFSGLSWDRYFDLDPATEGETEYTTSADSLTTAKGTFQCTKYATSSGYAEFWVCPDVPLVAKYHNSVTDMTWEPADWG